MVAVISIAKLRGGAARAAYYLDRAADCDPSGYYLDQAEPAGRWCGHGAAALGLDGSITDRAKDAFASLLGGALPDGSLVARPVLRQDPNGPDGARVDIRRCGFDIVVSAPKSVSVLFALADPSTAAAVEAAHEYAVRHALGYLERLASHGLRGHQGGDQRATRIGTDGLIAARFTHRTSRSDDPQLHTHLVIPNLVHGRDGKWSAVDSRALYHQARTAGCVYQAVLRGELTRTLGVDWGAVRRGVAEISGVPKVLREEFSTRRKEIDAELDRTGTGGRAAAQRAAYVTRPAKTHTPETSLREQWADRTHQTGHNPEALVDQITGCIKPPAVPEDHLLARELFGLGGLTEHATSFDRRDLIQALTETIPPGTVVTGVQLEAIADRLLADSDEAVPLLQPVIIRNEHRWSTRNLIAAEQWALNAAGRKTTIPSTPFDKARAVADAPRLSAEQQAVVTGLLVSPDLIDVVVGPAGSGKTAALKTAAEHWTRTGVPVIGCAVAAITARRLEAATKVPSMSLARLLNEARRPKPVDGRPEGLAAQTVVFCDEASMIGTGQLVQLLHHVQAVGGKLVLVGDPEQLAEVNAGGLFAAFARTTDPLSLTGNQRQIATWETAALTHLRDGQIDAAVDAYIGHGRIHIGTDSNDARGALARSYVEHYRDRGDVVALTSSQRDTASLNIAIRTIMQADDEIGPDVVTVACDDGDRSYGLGEQVIVTRNDHRNGLLNGTRCALVDVGTKEITLLRDDTNEEVKVTPAWAAEHLDYGYAMTVHKAQGLTTRISLLYGTAALCQQAGYVAMSRGTHANHLYTSDTALNGDRGNSETAAPNFELMTGPDDVLDRLRERLAINHRHILASDQQPLLQAAEVRRSPYRDLYSHDRHAGRSR